MGSEEDNAVKEVEVTAKQIVDRISVQMQGSASSSSGVPATIEEKMLKMMNSERKVDAKSMLSKRISLSSAYGVEVDQMPGQGVSGEDLQRSTANEDGAGKEDLAQRPRSSVGSIQGAFIPENLPTHLTEHEKKAEVLLNAVTKWLGEIGSDTEADAKEHIGVDSLVPENFHWVFSIESYIRSLNRTSQKALTSKIVGLIVNWHKQLFHFAKPKQKDEPEYNRTLAHWDSSHGVVAMMKFNLYSKFPNFLSKGFETFTEEGRWPVLFCSNEETGTAIALKLGLPKSYVVVFDTRSATWISDLQKCIEDSAANNKVPIACIFNVDSKNITQACEVAEGQNIWVHLYGANILAYLIERAENTQIGSSFTLDLTMWIQNPKLPYLTLYKHVGKIEPTVLESCDLNSHYCDVSAFAPWLVTSIVGHDEIRNLVKEVTTRGRFLLNMMRKYECLHVVPDWCEVSSGNEIATSITFQYNPPNYVRGPAATASAESNNKDKIDVPSTQYVDTLNSWLYHIMDRDLKEFAPVEFVHSATGGWNVHVDVLRCPKFEPEDEEVIVSLFDNHLSVLQSTVAQKKVFSKLVEESQELAWVDHESQWAGIGAVRYIPSFHRTKSQVGTEEQATSSLNITDDGIKDHIDHLNAQIVDKLKSIDSAFSLGESSNGEWCVQFGMVTMETDVKELVRLVVSAGQEIEESSEFLSRMSELVKQGIVKATEELKKESEEALWEEGILRRVPVVGTFVNWLSPPAKETGVRGRALNLTQGKVESTENIYKYHMQVEAPPTNQQ